MAYVSVPKDLTKVKNKVAFNLTKRQLICIGIGAAMGIPSYFLLRNVMGNSNAATVMVLLMLPAFLFAMYEKDGMHLEDVLMHMIRVKFLRPPVRKYETENYYETDPEQIRQSPDAGKPKGGKTVAKKEKRKRKKKSRRKNAGRKNCPSSSRSLIRKWEEMESAGYREKLILSVSAFMTSTTSWLRMKIKMQSLKTGVTSSITLTAASIFS